MGFGLLLASLIGAGLTLAGFTLFVGLDRLERWLESSTDAHSSTVARREGPGAPLSP
jgi:hypothetical protein